MNDDDLFEPYESKPRARTAAETGGPPSRMTGVQNMIGWLSDSDVQEKLQQIRNLPARAVAA